MTSKSLFAISLTRTLLAILLTASSMKALADTKIITADKGPYLTIQIFAIRPAYGDHWEPTTETSLNGYARRTVDTPEHPRLTYTPGPRSPFYARSATSGYHDFYLKIYNAHNEVTRNLTLQGAVGYELWKIFKSTSPACPVTLEIERETSTLVSVDYPCSLDE